jgi:hypothetical protein
VDHGPKIFRHGESSAANRAKAHDWLKVICTNLPHSPANPTEKPASIALLTWIGALGCIAGQLTMRFDTGVSGQLGYKMRQG